MSACHLYDTWIRTIHELLPQERVTRVRNVAWMIIGLYLNQSVHLSNMARKLPFVAKLTSITDRFRRFLDNEAFRPRSWYRPIAQKLLAEAACCGPVRLILDSTKIGARRQLLIVTLAYRKRALPIAWTWVQGARGHSTTIKQLALLSYVHSLIPANAKALLVGDCEFGAVALAQRVERWHWGYVLRQQGDTRVCVSRTALSWVHFASLVTQRDELLWYEQALVTIKHLYHANLLAYWDTNEKEPWLLMTNLTQAHIALKTYRKRMWIEEMFGDWQGHGVDIEKTHLRRCSRLSRLVFLVALLYLWLVTRGVQTIKSGLRHLVDRLDRRDLSVFRIGLYIVDRCLALVQSLTVRLIPCFESVR
jgi:hypothetical protein